MDEAVCQAINALQKRFLRERKPLKLDEWLQAAGICIAGAAAIWAGFTKEPLWVITAAAAFGALAFAFRGRISMKVLVLFVATATLANLIVGGALLVTAGHP